MKPLALLVLPLALACSTPSSVTPVSVPLQYKTMASPGEFTALPACAAISRVDVVDKRTEPNLGKRFVEGKNSLSAPVTTSSDVAAWVRSGVEQALQRGGVTVGKAGGPVLHVTIDQISTSENVLHRSGYEGRVMLAGELRGSSSCWQSRTDGFAENYGYSGSVENYQETLNHALDRAVIRMFDAPAFRTSVCSMCK